MTKEKAEYSKPTSQLDLEARQADDYVVPAQVGPAVDPQLSDNGYVGVDKIYQNSASHVDAPYEGDPESAEGKVHAQFLSDDVEFGTTVIGGIVTEEEGGDGGTPATSPTPPTKSTTPPPTTKSK